MDSDKEIIKNLIEHNDELENYFRNTIIPQLFVDADLILQKFTPPAMKQFSLSKSDIGRSLSDIKDNFRYTSDQNTSWLTGKQLKAMVEKA